MSESTCDPAPPIGWARVGWGRPVVAAAGTEERVVVIDDPVTVVVDDPTVVVDDPTVVDVDRVAGPRADEAVGAAADRVAVVDPPAPAVDDPIAWLLGG